MTDTCGALRDVALLPFPCQGCVAPESAPITWISTEVVFSYIFVLVFVRSLFRPVLAIFSRLCLIHLALVVFSIICLTI